MSLLDLFYEREGKADTAKPTPAVAKPAVNTVLRTPTVAVPTSPVHAEQSATDRRFDEHFMRLFDKMNLPGPDYYEWAKAEAALVNKMPNEAARREAVMAMLSTQGLTRDILLETAAKYRAGVEGDINNYERAVTAKMTAEIEPKRAALEAARASVKNEEEQIARLRAAIDARVGDIAKMEAELDTDEASLERAKAGYSAARASALAKIDSDIAYINTTT